MGALSRLTRSFIGSVFRRNLYNGIIGRPLGAMPSPGVSTTRHRLDRLWTPVALVYLSCLLAIFDIFYDTSRDVDTVFVRRLHTRPVVVSIAHDRLSRAQRLPS